MPIAKSPCFVFLPAYIERIPTVLLRKAKMVRSLQVYPPPWEAALCDAGQRPAKIRSPYRRGSIVSYQLSSLLIHV